MKEKTVKPWHMNIIIYMLLIMAGNPCIMLYKSSVFTMYKIFFTMLVLFVFWKYKDNLLRVKREKIEILLIFYSLITFSVVMNADRAGISTLISYYIFILLGMLISELWEPESFGRQYVQVMLFVCFIALIGFGIQSVWPGVLDRLLWTSVHSNEMNVYRSNIFYSTIMDKRFSTAGQPVFLNRICGPFWEPGILSCFVSGAMVCLIENRKRVKNFAFKLFVFIITMVLTVSMTGALALAVIVIWYTLKNVRIFGVYIALACFGLLAVGIQMFDFILNRILFSIPDIPYRIGLEKLTPENTIKSLFWGQSYSAPVTYNGYINLFLMFGAAAVFCWIMYLLKGCHAVTASKSILPVIVLLGLTTEPIAFSSFFWVLVFYSKDYNSSMERKKGIYDRNKRDQFGQYNKRDCMQMENAAAVPAGRADGGYADGFTEERC